MKTSVSCSILLSVLLIGHPMEASAQKPPSSPSAKNPSLTSEAEAVAKSVSASRSQSDRIKLLTAFGAFIDREKNTARAALEKAERTGASQAEIDRLDRIDSEVVRLHLAFETVFEDVMTKSFESDPEYRRRTCKNAPRQIRFEETAGAPDGTKLSRFRELAIQVVEAMCEPAPGK